MRLKNEFLPGQEQDGQSRDPSEGGVPSPNESGARPNIQIFPAMESLPQTFGRLNSARVVSVRLVGDAKLEVGRKVARKERMNFQEFGSCKSCIFSFLTFL